MSAFVTCGVVLSTVLMTWAFDPSRLRRRRGI